MGALKGLFDGEPPVTPVGPRCGVGVILSSLDDEDAARVREVLVDTRWEPKHVAERLTNAGHRVSTATIRRHRSKGCSCEALGLA
jgi:hypothetical protein